MHSFEFRYDHSYDTNGIFYWIGTNFGVNFPSFSLLYLAKYVQIHTSEGESSYCYRDETELLQENQNILFNNPIVHILNYIDPPKRIFLGRGIGSWFCFDIGPYMQILPTMYTLRHSSAQHRAPRNWILQGTNVFHPHGNHKDENWDTIDTRINDTSINVREHSFASFSIQVTLHKEATYPIYVFCSITKFFFCLKSASVLTLLLCYVFCCFFFWLVFVIAMSTCLSLFSYNENRCRCTLHLISSFIRI